MTSAAWGGHRAQRGRALCAPLVAQGVPCYRCGLPILPGQKWHADHVQQRSTGGSDEPANLWPSHATCNTRDGNRITHQIKRAKRAAAQLDSRTDERRRGIRGL